MVFMILFTGNIFILGCGSIVQCLLPLILKHIAIEPNRITIMDFIDNRTRITEELRRGICYIQEQLTPQNYSKILSQHLKKKDLFIDLSYGVSSIAMIEWCHTHGVCYLNASTEVWNVPTIPLKNPSEATLYSRQMALQELVQSWDHPGPTAVIDHGANPGLVSHLTKQGLVDLAQYFLTKKPKDSRAKNIQSALEKENFAKLAYLLGIKTIHISEKDTQTSKTPKIANEFINTWSVEGFIEEAIAPAEMGWGTHERSIPKGGLEHKNGPCNQIFLSQKGMSTWVQSWVPSGSIAGMVIRHGESFSISNHLTLKEGDKVIYRPTVHYAYHPCEMAIKSLEELKARQFKAQTRKRILNDDITSGQDELGCLLMGHDFNSWWIGSVLDIHEASTLVPHQNATTLQVAVGMLAALIYIIQHPEKGFCQPDDLPYKQILKIARPYLGKIISKPVDWHPLRNFQELPTEKDKWQFSTFLLPAETFQPK